MVWGVGRVVGCPRDHRPFSLFQPPLRTITFPFGPGGTLLAPSCHAWRALGAADAAAGVPDVLVGLADGAAVALSLAAQLGPAGGASTAPAAGELLPGGDCGAARSAAWAPDGAAVVAAASGEVAVHRPPWRMVAGCAAVAAPASPALAGTSPTSPPARPPPRPPPTPLLAAPAGATAGALSPDGTLLATAGADGVLRVHSTRTGALISGFQAYYGSLAAVAWSPDGRCVAAGGEDDCAAVFGLAERCALGWADGADSWVSALAFDPHPPPAPAGERMYRLAVASQDCCVALHDVAAPDADVAAGLPPLSPRAGGGGGWGSPFAGGGRDQGEGDGSADSDRDATPSPAPTPPLLPPQIAPAPAFADMARIPPVARAVASADPLTDVAFSAGALITADACGGVRVWARPLPRPRSEAVESGEHRPPGSAGPPRSAPLAAPARPAPARRLGPAASGGNSPDLMSL